VTGGTTSGTATVLFTDLVGSTELMARLGDVAFDALRGEHFAGLREALAAHGGEEVKNTGDGVMATFSSAVQALGAAVATQQAAHCQALSAEAPVSIRVGLSLGEVTFERGDVFGTPVVEAARLVAAARPGQILATTVVRMVAGSRAPTAMTDIGTLDLKGLPEPVAACEVAWEPAEDTVATVPLPPLLTWAGRIFVGRDEELGRLRQLSGSGAWSSWAASPGWARLAWPPSSPTPSTTKGRSSWPAAATRISGSPTSRSWRPCATMSPTPPIPAWAATPGSWGAWYRN
jgi:class 3 adenylate cyclase